MKLTKIKPNIPAWDTSTQDVLLSKIIESVQQQVEEQHRNTIWKHCRVNPYSLSREVLDILSIRLVVDPQHNRQWLEQRGERIGPIVETSLTLPPCS